MALLQSLGIEGNEMIVRFFEVDCHRCGKTYTIRNWGGALECEVKIMDDTLKEWDKENVCPICKTPFNDLLDTIHEPPIKVMEYAVSSREYIKTARNIELSLKEAK